MVGRALPLAAASPRVRPPANARPASLGGCAASTVQQPRPVRRPPSASPSSSPPLLRSTFPRPCLPACLRARRCRCACAAAPPVPRGAPAPGLVVLQGAPPSPTGRPSSESCHGPPEPRLSLSPTGASGDPSGVAAACQCLPAAAQAGRQAAWAQTRAWARRRERHQEHRWHPCVTERSRHVTQRLRHPTAAAAGSLPGSSSPRLLARLPPSTPPSLCKSCFTTDSESTGLKKRRPFTQWAHRRLEQKLINFTLTPSPAPTNGYPQLLHPWHALLAYRECAGRALPLAGPNFRCNCRARTESRRPSRQARPPPP